MDLARRRMAFPATDLSADCDCCGYLMKLDGLSKTWKRRFCVLTNSSLYLYVDEDSTSAIGILTKICTVPKSRDSLIFICFLCMSTSDLVQISWTRAIILIIQELITLFVADTKCKRATAQDIVPVSCKRHIYDRQLNKLSTTTPASGRFYVLRKS